MLFVAEIGSCHMGSKSLAFELIRQASLAGADIAKFQLGHPKVGNDRWGAMRYIDDWAPELNDWCQHFDIEFMASIWSPEGLKAARSVGMKRYKVAFQMRDETLLRMILSDGKEVFISGHPGLTSPKGVKWIYVVSEYPTFPKDVRIPRHMGGLHRYWGLSSHSHGTGDALLAIARGARYIEKHLTIDRNDFRDTQFALIPDEFAAMVRYGKEIARFR